MRKVVTINYSDREIFQIHWKMIDITTIEPNNINFIKLKKYILTFIYKHIKSSYDKQDLNRLFLFENKNDKK